MVLEVKDTGGHAVDEMSDSENGITLEVGKKTSGQQRERATSKRRRFFSFSNPNLLEGVSKGIFVNNSFRG